MGWSAVHWCRLFSSLTFQYLVASLGGVLVSPTVATGHPTTLHPPSADRLYTAKPGLLFIYIKYYSKNIFPRQIYPFSSSKAGRTHSWQIPRVETQILMSALQWNILQSGTIDQIEFIGSPVSHCLASRGTNTIVQPQPASACLSWAGWAGLVNTIPVSTM